MIAKLLGGFSFIALAVAVLGGNASAINRTVPVEVEVPDTTISVSGLSSPFSLVSIREGASTIATTSADADGNYSATLTSQVSGLRTFSVFADDDSGARSAVNTQTISVSPQQNTAVTFNIAPTLIRRTPIQTTNNSVIQFNGYAVPNSVVVLNVSGSDVLNTTSNANGFYEFIYATNGLAIGLYTATVQVSSVFNIPVSNIAQFEIVSSDDSSIDIVVDPIQLPPPVPLQPENNATIVGDQVLISGESVPNAQIIIYQDGEIIGSILANDSGQWSFIFTATYTPTTLSFEACIDGRCSVLSTLLTLNFPDLSQLACEVDIRLEQYRFWGVSAGDQLTLQLTEGLGADAVIEIEWGDETSEKFDYESGISSNEFQKIYETASSYNGTIRAVGDNCGERYFSVQVVDEDAQGENYFLLFLLVIIFAVVMYMSQRDKLSSVQK